jgi:hypothetical protein
VFIPIISALTSGGWPASSSASSDDFSAAGRSDLT